MIAHGGGGFVEQISEELPILDERMSWELRNMISEIAGVVQ